MFIAHNQQNISSLADCFTVHPLWFDVYRPLTTNLYYYLGRLWFDSDVRIFHAVNVAFFLINALLLFWISRKLMPGWWAVAAPILWVTRIAHTEVLTNSCEFQILLATFFSLLSLGLFLQARTSNRSWMLVASVAAFALALLSKEVAIVIAGILIAFGLLYDRRRAWRRYVWHAGVAGLWALLYFGVYKQITSGDPSGFVFSWSPGNLSTYLTAYFLLFSDWLLYPLKSVVMDPSVAILAAHWSVRIAVLVLLAAALVYAVLWRRLDRRHRDWMRPVAFGLLFFVCAAAPHLILDGRLFMRYSYLPHAGLAIAGAALLGCAGRFVVGRVGMRAGLHSIKG